MKLIIVLQLKVTSSSWIDLTIILSKSNSENDIIYKKIEDDVI